MRRHTVEGMHGVGNVPPENTFSTQADVVVVIVVVVVTALRGCWLFSIQGTFTPCKT